MLDIFNHLAIFGILFVVSFVFNGFKNNDDLKYFPFEFFFSNLILSIMVMVFVEILAWSIYYLSGAGV